MMKPSLPKPSKARLIISLPLGTAARNFLTGYVVDHLLSQRYLEVLIIVPTNLEHAMQDALPFKVVAYDFDKKPSFERIMWKLYCAVINVVSLSATPKERYARQKQYVLQTASVIGQNVARAFPRLSKFIVGFFQSFLRVYWNLKTQDCTDFSFFPSDRYVATSAHLLAEQRLICSAKKAGAKFDAFVHSWDVPSSKPYFCYNPHTFFVPDREVKSDLKRYSFVKASGGVKVVGSPRYAALKTAFGKTEGCKKKVAKRVLYATSQAAYFPNEVEFIKELAQRFPNVIFDIRIHPQEPPAQFQNLDEDNIKIESRTAFVEGLPDKLDPLVETEADFIKLLSGYDVVICTASSMAVDATIAGKNVALLKLGNLSAYSKVQNLYKTHHGQRLLSSFRHNVIDDFADLEEFFATPKQSKLAGLDELTDPSLIHKIWEL